MYRTLGVVVLILALVAAVLLMAGCPKPKTDVTPMSGMMPKGGPGPGMTPPPPMTPPPAVGEIPVTFGRKTPPVPHDEEVMDEV